jgi:hypothetical protein
MFGTGLLLGSSPEHDCRGEGDGGSEHLGASVVSVRDPAPVLQAAAHDLDAVAALGSALVMLGGTTARLPAGGAGLYPFVFQRISETVGIVDPVSQQPFCLRQAAQQSGCTRVIADLTCGHEETARTPIGIGDGTGDGMQLRVHAAFGSADQTSPRSLGLPFSTAGSTPCGAPSGKSRRSSPTSEQRPRQPDHPSFGRRCLCRSTASRGCRGSSAGHIPSAQRVTASHCDC